MTLYEILTIWTVLGIGFEWSAWYIASRASLLFAAVVGWHWITRETQKISDLGSQFVDENTWITPLWILFIGAFVFWVNASPPPVPHFNLTITPEAVEYTKIAPPARSAKLIKNQEFWQWAAIILFLFNCWYTLWALSDEWQNIRASARNAIEGVFGTVAATAGTAAGALAAPGLGKALTAGDYFRFEVLIALIVEGFSYLLNVLLHKR